MKALDPGMRSSKALLIREGNAPGQASPGEEEPLLQGNPPGAAYLPGTLGTWCTFAARASP